jgi:hypothetical protein
MVTDLKTSKPDSQGNTQGILSVRNIHEDGVLATLKAALANWTPVPFVRDVDPTKELVVKSGTVTLTVYARVKGGGITYVAMGRDVPAVIEACADLPHFPADKAMELIGDPKPAAVTA